MQSKTINVMIAKVQRKFAIELSFLIVYQTAFLQNFYLLVKIWAFKLLLFATVSISKTININSLIKNNPP